MKKLKQELLRIAQIWNASGKYDDTEYKGRYFISEDHLGEFADENGFVSDDAKYEIETACDCQIVFNYAGENIGSRFLEIIFN